MLPIVPPSHSVTGSDELEEEKEKNAGQTPLSNADPSRPLTATPRDPDVACDPNALSAEEARLLTDLLSANQRDARKKKQALITIANKAAFTRNHVSKCNLLL